MGAITVDKRTEKFSNELLDLMKWEETESEKVYNRLKSEGKTVGLDGFPEEFIAIRKERNLRLKAILEKYNDLPHDTEIRLW